MFVCFVITVQKPSIVKMPKSIERCVRKQNIMFMHEGTQFSAEYFQFMKRLLTCNQIYTHTSSSQDKLVSNLVHTTLYTLHTLNSICLEFVSNRFFHPIRLPYYLKIWISISWRQTINGCMEILRCISDITLSCLKKDYTLRCLEYICSISSPLKHHGLSLRLRPQAS